MGGHGPGWGGYELQNNDVIKGIESDMEEEESGGVGSEGAEGGLFCSTKETIATKVSDVWNNLIIFCKKLFISSFTSTLRSLLTDITYRRFSVTFDMYNISSDYERFFCSSRRICIC